MDMIMHHIKQVLVALAITLGAVAAHYANAHEFKLGDLEITHPWERQSPMKADVMGGFLKITNHGSSDDRLVAVKSSIAKMIQLHEMKMEGDVMKMVELTGGIAIAAGATVELRPKSLHVMFMGVPKQPSAGDHFRAVLVFEKSGQLEVDFIVEK